MKEEGEREKIKLREERREQRGEIGGEEGEEKERRERERGKIEVFPWSICKSM